MFKKFGFGMAVSVMLLAGCSSDPDATPTDTFDCEGTKSKCPSDEALTKEAIATCKALTTDPVCGQVFRDLSRCAADRQVCTAGKTDQPATESACATQKTAACKCAGIKGDGGVGSCPATN